MSEQPSLLDVPESKSPRLLWMEEHRVQTHYAAHLAGQAGEEDEFGFVAEPWSAFIGTIDDIAAECRLMEDDGRLAYGMTEEEALLNLVAGGRVPHWNPL